MGWRGIEFFHVRMGTKHLMKTAAEDSFAVSMHDAQPEAPGHEGAVEKLVNLLTGLFGGTPDDVDLHRSLSGLGQHRLRPRRARPASRQDAGATLAGC